MVCGVLLTKELCQFAHSRRPDPPDCATAAGTVAEDSHASTLAIRRASAMNYWAVHSNYQPVVWLARLVGDRSSRRHEGLR